MHILKCSELNELAIFSKGGVLTTNNLFTLRDAINLRKLSIVSHKGIDFKTKTAVRLESLIKLIIPIKCLEIIKENNNTSLRHLKFLKLLPSSHELVVTNSFDASTLNGAKELEYLDIPIFFNSIIKSSILRGLCIRNLKIRLDFPLTKEQLTNWYQFIDSILNSKTQ